MYDPSLLFGTLGPPRGQGTSGIYTGFEVKDPEVKTDIPVLPSWGEGKKPQLVSCQGSSLGVTNTNDWVKYHKSDSAYREGSDGEPPTPLRNSGRKNGSTDSSVKTDNFWQNIGKFLSINWWIILVAVAVVVVIFVLARIISEKRILKK
jgi:hypothetical protein